MKKVSILVCVLAIVLCFANTGYAQDKVDVSTLTNIALNKPVTEKDHNWESTSWNKDFVNDGFKMVDKEPSTSGWFSKVSSNKEDTTWIYIDLEAVYNISTVAVYPRETGLYFPVSYEIQLSTDAENWTTVKSVTGDSGKIDVDRTFSITPKQARYVRVLVTERYNAIVEGGYIAQISEIEVYGSKAETEPETETNAETGDESMKILTSCAILLSAAVILLSVSRKRVMRDLT